MKRLILVLAIISCFLYTSAWASEISLYNNKGNAVAYIDVSDDLTIYLWDGKPVAYLDGDNIYGFNGNHLGWYLKGAIVNHDGDGPCIIKERYPGHTSYESYKGYKEYKPYKSYKEYAPYKPNISNRFSKKPCELYLSKGG